VLLPHELLDRAVEVLGAHVVPAAAPGAVDEQVLPAAAAAQQPAHQPVHPRVGQPQGALDAALGEVLELHRAPAQADVVAPQRGQPERALLVAVAGRVLVAAGPEHTDVEHPHPAREHPLLRQPARVEAAHHLRADVGHPAAQVEHPLVLHEVAGGAPQVVVAVLAAPAASVPTAWMCPVGSGEIQTSRHAGGMTRALSRATTSGSVIGRPSSSR
jgi:hypothetical protein